MADQLGNAVWFPLDTLQVDLGFGDGAAKRYRPEISPFAALESSGDFSALNEIVKAQEVGWIDVAYRSASGIATRLE